MKSRNRSLMIVAAGLCLAAILAPAAFAAGQGQGTMQGQGMSGAGTGSTGANAMQAPPSGSPGGTGGPGNDAGREDGQGSGQDPARPSPPSGGMDNATFQDMLGGHGIAGNGTLMRHGGTGTMTFGNATAPGSWPGDRDGGNMTFRNSTNIAHGTPGAPGMMGNMTPPDSAGQDFGNMTPPAIDGDHRMLGNGSMMHGWGGNGTYENVTAPGTGPDGDRGMPQSDGQSPGQQAKDDLVAGFISQLQALLSKTQ